MKLPFRRRWLLFAALLLVGLAVAVRGRGISAPQPPAQAAAAAETPSPLPPPARLRVRVAAVQAEVTALLDPDAAAWAGAKPTRVLLNRTPRLYQTEPPQEHPIPSLEVRAVRVAGLVCFRLQWTDTTHNAPVAPEKRGGLGGDPARLYRRPTGETNVFADAAAVMVPEKWTGPAFPSLLMGDKGTPARLYYWNASGGAEELKASGRGTVEGTGHALAHRARHADGRWTLTLATPETPEGCPLAFAVWDGQLGDRDGLKFFSIWYVLAYE
jgi:hypothetical protein